MTISSLLKESTAKLSNQSDTPSLDAQVLLADVLEVERAWLLAHREERVPAPAQGEYIRKIDQLLAGTPLPYILGRWEFFGLTFRVTPEVLIPRPETELLVEHALDWLDQRDQPACVADIGTGSGCIGVSIAVHTKESRVIATDPVQGALYIARDNVQRHAVNSRVELVQTNLLAGVVTRFDLICANLPYIPTGTLQQLAVFGKEPNRALDGGPDGWQVIGACLDSLPRSLAANGIALLEIEASQGKMAEEHAKKLFPDADVRIVKDLAGLDRLLKIAG